MPFLPRIILSTFIILAVAQVKIAYSQNSAAESSAKSLLQLEDIKVDANVERTSYEPPLKAAISDYTVKRAITPTLSPDLLRPSLPVPPEQWKAYDQMVKSAQQRYNSIDSDFPDYCCVVTMQERVDGELRDRQRAKVLVRSQPFSVYMKFISPDQCEGREILYVDGQYNNRIIVTKGGPRPTIAHITRAILPDSELAASSTTHKITEFGVSAMMKQLLEVAEYAEQFPDCQIEFIEGASVDNRPCTVIQVRHEPQSEAFPFYFAQIFIDNQWQVPVRFVCYDWPKPGQKPELIGEFTYTDIKRNIGTTDYTFDYHNPNYNFKKDLKIPD